VKYEQDWLKQWALYAPSSVAFEDGETGRTLSYGEAYELSLRMSASLQRNYQISFGDRVAVLAQNELEYLVLFFALQRLGAILVPLNFRLTPRELSHCLEDSEPKLVLYGREYATIIEQCTGLVGVNRIPFLGQNGFCDRLSEESALVEGISSTVDDVNAVMIIYTSGTTGAPKGAVMTHQMIFWNSINTTLRLNISQSDSAVIFLPLFHTGGWNVLTLPFVHRGAKTILVKKFDGEKVLRLTADKKCTLLFGVPTTLDLMSRSEYFSRSDLSSVRYAIVGGEPMPIELIRKWAEKGVAVRQGYGLTEFGPNVFSLSEADAIRKIGSIGQPNFYIQAKVVDDHGDSILDGKVGELWLKGPMTMKEYWRNEKATQQTIRNEWLATGDLVRCDSEGYYYVVGRKKDMYISGGENVYPTEIEQVLLSIPGMREAAVVGVADSKWGEVGKAYLVRENSEKGQCLTYETVYQVCLKNLAKFKIPKYFEFISELPKGDSGKILKKNLDRNVTESTMAASSIVGANH
jgi:fatty-acyl-CoA synthase